MKTRWRQRENEADFSFEQRSKDKKCRHYGSDERKTIFSHSKLALRGISQGKAEDFHGNQDIAKRRYTC